MKKRVNINKFFYYWGTEKIFNIFSIKKISGVRILEGAIL